MKKIMGHLTGKLSLSILSVIVLLVGLLAGKNGITSVKASGKSPAASAVQASSKVQASPSKVSAAPVAINASASAARVTTAAADTPPVGTPAAFAAKTAKEKVTKEAASHAMSKIPLLIEPNRGQTSSKVKFVARSMGYQAYLTGPATAMLEYRASEKDASKVDFLTMKLAGANNSAAAEPLEPTGGVSNYILGADSSKWITNVPHYSKLRYGNVYPGVDVIYQGDNARFRYDFQVNPGADPKAIQIAYEGGKGLSIDKDGNAVVDLGSGRMIASKPVIFQEYGGQKHSVDGSYVITASNTVAFEVGAYDKSQALVIDPSDTYAAYYGAGATTFFNTVFNSVAVDNANGIYMVGWTSDLALPTAGTPTAGIVGVIVVAPLDLTKIGTITAFGAAPATQTGSSFTLGNGVSVFGGAAFVVGATNAGSNWPSSATPLEASTFAKVPNVNPHAFLMKFTAGAGTPAFSSLLYGSGTEFASAVSVEQTGANAGRVHITGGTTSGTSVGTPGPSTFLLNLPMTTGASAPFQPNQSSSSASTNAFYLAVNKGLASVDYATLFGGYGTDYGASVAVDPIGNGYIVGTSNSFGAGTVVGIQDGSHTQAPELTNGPTGPNSALTGQFMFATPQGSGCPISPVVAFVPPIPPTTFFGIPTPAQGTAIVSEGSVIGITLTSAGSGYDPILQQTVPFAIAGCLGGIIPGFGVVQHPAFSTSANNLPIPGDTFLVTNPGTLYNPLAPPLITFTGGGCGVEPTASAIVSITAPFGLTQLVLNTPGTGCTSAPTVTIQAPPTIAGEAAGFQATAIYIPGTAPIGIDQSGTVQANFHAFIAKFNPNVIPAPLGPLPSIATLSYGFAIGNILATNSDHVALPPGTGTCTLTGNTNSVPPPASTGTGGLLAISTGNVPFPPGIDGIVGECETGTAVAVDQYGNAYIGGDTLVPDITQPTPTTPGIFNGNLSNVVFSSPGVAGGEINSIAVTAAGTGYGSGTVPVFFDFTHDINGGCYRDPAATAHLDGNGGVMFITIDNPGFGCTSVPGIGIVGNNGIGFHGIATLATALAGNTGLIAGNTTLNLATGWVMEVVSNQVINNGLTTTSTQDGIPLGPHSPSSVAAFPAMVYATNVRGDEACTTCIGPNVAGGFGNGAGVLPANPPTGTATAPVNFDSVVTGIAVDALGQAYVSGADSSAIVPPANGLATDQPVMLRRRINARGFPSNPLTMAHPNAAAIEAPNTQFLSTYPALPNTGPSNIFPNTGLTPFGSIELGPINATPPNAGAFLSMAFEPTTLTSCSVGFIENQVQITGAGSDASGTGIFPTGTQSQPAVFAAAKTYLGTQPTADGFVACTQFQDDIVVGTGCVSGVNCNPVSNPTPTSLIFTMPAGTQQKLPNGATNPVFPTPLTINGTLDGTLPTGATISLGTINQVYYQGRTADGGGNGPDSSGAPNVNWLVATPFGSSIQLSLNPSILHGAPGASFLDPGIYYCLVSVTPTLTGGVADNANIPQTVIVTLNITGMLEINTTVGGGIPATGTNPTTGAITVSLQQGGAATGAWNVSQGGTLDAAGNLVLNIPVWSNVPLNSPTHSHMVYLVNQGGLAAPATNEVVLPPFYAGPQPQTFIGAGVTAGSLVSPYQILGTGLNTANQNLFFTTGFNIPVGATTGGVFLTPAFESIANPGGGASNDVAYLPPGGIDCSPNFVNPPDTRDPTSKGGSNDTVCYIQVILPPTILQGAPTGAYTVNLQLQSVPDLTNPETPVRNDISLPYLDYSIPYLSQNQPTPNATAAPYVENFCVGSAQCGAVTPSSYAVVPPPAATIVGTIPITVQVSPGPLIINSPWVSNNITHCLTAPAAGPGLFFSVPECNTNSPTIPLAPFTVPTGWVGLVTSNINSASNGNNPANTYNNVVLDTRNLGLSAPSTFTATYTPGLGSVSLGAGVTVPALQVQNDYMVYQIFSTPTIYPTWVVPTCTTSSPAIPAGVIQFPASGTLPISTPGFSTTAFTIGINTAGVTPALTNGFYAGVITVTPNGSATQASQIPVCLEVGNNIIPQYETIPQPFTVPPPFDPTGNIVPPSGLIIEAGNTQYVQVIASVLGPNQQPPISGTQTFGTPSFVAVPVSITPSPSNPSFVMPLVAPANIGNEFSIIPLGTITEGINTATNCSLITGAPNGPCLTNAYMDFVIAANSATTPGQPVVVNFSFTDSQPTTSLLWATDPPPPLNVFITSGPALIYTPTPNTNPTNGVLAYITLLPSPPLALFGGAGYTSVPNISFHGGCTTEPTAIASISQPGASGFVTGITVTNPGAGCSSAPVITIDPPSTPGGIVALAQAFISNGVLSYTFNQVVNTPSASSTSCQTTAPGGSCVGPVGSSFQAITVQASTAGISVQTPSALVGTVYYNPPAGILNLAGWLDVASVNCQPIFVNPTPLTECEFTLSTNSNVTLLQQGTYQAYAQFVATGFPANTEPAIVSVLVTLNVTSQATVSTTGLATGIATFGYVIGGSTTTPPSQSTNLSVNALPSGVTGIPFTATATPSTTPAGCPAPCAFIQLNGGNAPVTGNLTTSPIPVSISINPALLQFFNVPGQTFNGVVTVTTPSSETSNPTLTIPVTLTVSNAPGLSFGDTVDSTVHCGSPSAAGNVSCTASAAFTIGQDVPDGGGGAAPPAFTTVLTLNGTPDTINITSNVPWLIPSLASTTQTVTPVTISIDPTKISPLAAGPIVGIITAKGVNGAETATFTVTLTVAAPPTITMTAIAPQVVSFGTAAFNVTTNVGLSVAPANPTTLPVSCTVTGGSSWLSVGTGNPTSLSATAAPFTFVITPSGTPQPVGTFSAGQITCITTGGITPAITNHIAVSLTVNGSLNDTTPSGTAFGNYTVGNPPPTLPLGIWSSPTGATVSIASSATWLSVSTTPVTAGTQAAPTMVTVSIVTSDPAITGAANGASLTANLTLTAPQSFLDCAPPTGTGTTTGLCTVVIPFTVTVLTSPAITTSPASGSTITFNLPTLAGAPGADTNAHMSVAVIAKSGNTLQAVPFIATPTVVSPAGGTWLGATGGTTTASGPAATSDVTATVGSLAQGTYAGAVAFAAASGSTGAQGQSNVGVLLNVGTLAVSGGPVSFFHQFGVTNPATSTLQVSAGPAAINWVASVTPNTGTPNCNWLIPGALSGTTPNNGSNAVSVSYNVTGLPDANAVYNCTINYSPAASYGASAADTVPVLVTLTTSINPVWVVNPNTTQTVTVLQGSTTAPGSVFQISASSILPPATTITATVTPFPNNPIATGPGLGTPIFTASASTLTVPASPGSVALTINANPTGLPVGTYQGSFTITSPAITGSAVVTVDLVVAAQCNFIVSPTGAINLTNVVPANGTTPVTVTGSFSVSPSSVAVCGGANPSTWMATSNASWLIITSGASGNGNANGGGTYEALSNPTTAARTATVTFTPSVGVISVIQFTQPGSTAPTLLRQVTALYQEILGRDPDAGGYTFWTGQGTNGLGLMVDNFLTSPESYNTNFGVMEAYQAATGAGPNLAAFNAAVLQVRLGGTTPAGLFTSLSSTVTGFSATTLYMNLLNRPPSSGEASACTTAGLANCFTNLTMAAQANATPFGPGTSLEFLSTGSFANHTASCTTGTCTVPGDHTNNLYIRLLYFTILSRDPDAGGLQFWFGIANTGGAGIQFQGSLEQPIRIQILGPGTQGQGFVGSPEFQALFQ